MKSFIRQRFVLPLAMLAMTGAALAVPLVGSITHAHAASPTAHAAHRWSVLGQPTVSASFIDQVLAAYHSPAAGTGSDLYADGVTVGIDPVFALAFFMHESSFGTAGIAQVTHSLGNIRCTPGYHSCYNGFRSYATWQDGYVDWYNLIHNVYVTQWGLTTVNKIIAVYAPPSDGNNVAAYIAAVKLAVTTWRKGQVIVP